jgi:hypothetical protein
MEVAAEGVLNAGEPSGQRAVAIFPSVTALPDGRLLASYRVGSAKDAPDEDVELRSSRDGGRSWSAPSRPFSTVHRGVRGSLRVVYTTWLGGRDLIAVAMWIDRQAYPGRPLFNPETDGCLPAAILIAHSSDLGETWSSWDEVPMPDDVGPPSLTNPVLLLRDGRLVISVETNKPYMDRSRWRQRVVYVFSKDGGRTWSMPQTTCEDPARKLMNWDQRAAVAPDGRIATFTWTFDTAAETYMPIARRLSSDGGATWSDPEWLGFSDQPARPAVFPDGSVVLAWVDRFGMSAIRARRAAAFAAPFPATSEVVAYRHRPSEQQRFSTTETLADMSTWSFGLPFVEALPSGDALLVYYAGTISSTDIRWALLRP